MAVKNKDRFRGEPLATLRMGFCRPSLASRIAEGKPVFSSQNIKMIISATVIYYIADPITCYEAK